MTGTKNNIGLSNVISFTKHLINPKKTKTFIVILYDTIIVGNLQEKNAMFLMNRVKKKREPIYTRT